MNHVLMLLMIAFNSTQNHNNLLAESVLGVWRAILELLRFPAAHWLNNGAGAFQIRYPFYLSR